MSAVIVEDLNNNFSLDNAKYSLGFEVGDGGIPVAKISNVYATACISLQGANVLSWQPEGEADVIWLSNDAIFSPGKSVRGGIPICWPWFGPHKTRPDFPAHGFARTCLWQVVGSRQLDSGETQVDFRLDTTQLDQQIQQMWSTATVLDVQITIGRTLSLSMTSCNNSTETIAIGEALHTYFSINDISETTVTGLEDVSYLDKTDSFKNKVQSGCVVIDGEVDRVYLKTSDVVMIDDGVRRIIIDKTGSQTTVIWNPGAIIAAKMGDLGVDGFRKMLCVESANAADDIIQLLPGERHTLTVTYSVQ